MKKKNPKDAYTGVGCRLLVGLVVGLVDFIKVTRNFEKSWFCVTAG